MEFERSSTLEEEDDELLELLLLEEELLDDDDESSSLLLLLLGLRIYTDFSKSSTSACERSRKAILSILESPLRVSFEDGRFAIELNNELLAEFNARDCGCKTIEAECSE